MSPHSGAGAEKLVGRQTVEQMIDLKNLEAVIHPWLGGSCNVLS